jgi:hypothetical protein
MCNWLQNVTYQAAFNAAQRKVILAMSQPHQDILDGYKALIAGYGKRLFFWMLSVKSPHLSLAQHKIYFLRNYVYHNDNTR